MKRMTSMLTAALMLMGSMSVVTALTGCVRGSALPEAGDQTPAASVNGRIITRHEVRRQMDQVIAQAPPHISEAQIELMLPRLRRAALDSLIDEVLVQQAEDVMGIAADEAEIRAEIAALDEYYRSIGSSLALRMDQSRMTTETLRQEVIGQIRYNKLIDTMLGLRAPTDEEMQAFYTENIQRYTWPRAVRLREILIAFPDDGPVRSRSPYYLRAQEAYQRLMAGEPFESVAREFSDSPTVMRGGEIGWINEEASLPSSIIEAAFSLQPGEISRIVETPFGYFILQVLERRPRQIVPFEEVRDLVADDMLLLQRQERRGELIERLRADAEIKIY